jgi:hypothetical protein
MNPIGGPICLSERRTEDRREASLAREEGGLIRAEARTPAFTRKRASPQARKRCPLRTILESGAQNAVWASVRECPLSPTGSFRPDRVTIEWRQR